VLERAVINLKLFGHMATEPLRNLNTGSDWAGFATQFIATWAVRILHPKQDSFTYGREKQSTMHTFDCLLVSDDPAVYCGGAWKSPKEQDIKAAMEKFKVVFDTRAKPAFMSHPHKFAVDMKAAIAIGSRHGLGKVRHMELKYLWLHQLVATKCVRVLKVRGTEHPPDMGTKHLSRESLAKGIDMVGLKRFPDIGIALVATVSKTARVGLAMLLLAAGSSAQEVEATSLTAEYKSWVAEGLLLSIVLILVTVIATTPAGRTAASSPAAGCTAQDVGTQTDSGEVPPPEVWIAPYGRRAHTNAGCTSLAKSQPVAYQLCKMCRRTGGERSCG
jgi:hypothetical protein